MTDNDDGQNRLLNPACAYARGVIMRLLIEYGVCLQFLEAAVYLLYLVAGMLHGC